MALPRKFTQIKLNDWLGNMMQKRWGKIGLVIYISLSVLSFNAVAEGKKIVKWVDSSGVTHYGDKLPSQESGRSNVEMSNKGVVLKKNVVLNQHEAEIDYQKEQEKLDKARRDKILLDSYTNAEEIDLARDRNLETEQAAIQALMQRKLINANKTTRNNKAAQNFKSRNQALPAYLNDDLKQTQLESDNLDKQIQQRKQNMLATDKHYTEEKARFIALKQHSLVASE